MDSLSGLRKIMKYDDASWHSGGDFPADLPETAAATHTGMFVAWAFLAKLAGEDILADGPEALKSLEDRSQTPGEFFLKMCDGKFTDADLNEAGNSFTAYYFDFETGNYLLDYGSAVADEYDSLYRTPDTWETFDSIAPVITKRFTEWQESGQ